MSARVNARSKYLVVAIMRYRLQYDGLHRRDVGELHLGYVQRTYYVGPACKTTNGEPQGLHTELAAGSIRRACESSGHQEVKGTIRMGESYTLFLMRARIVWQFWKPML